MAQMTTRKDLTIIGRAERIQFFDVSNHLVPAKIDTGADVSSVWASRVVEKDGLLKFRLFGPKSQYYTGQTITLKKGEYRLTRIANSFGGKELRYVVKLKVGVNGRIITSSFTLANRSAKIYPVLLGRRLLKGKFLVDVSQGKPLVAEERQKRAKLQVELNQRED